MKCCEFVRDESLTNIPLGVWVDEALVVFFKANTTLSKPFVTVKNVSSKPIKIGLPRFWEKELKPGETDITEFPYQLEAGTEFGVLMSLLATEAGEYKFEISCGDSGNVCDTHITTIKAGEVAEGKAYLSVVAAEIVGRVPENFTVELTVKNTGTVKVNEAEVALSYKGKIVGTATYTSIDAGETVMIPVKIEPLPEVPDELEGDIIWWYDGGVDRTTFFVKLGEAGFELDKYKLAMIAGGLLMIGGFLYAISGERAERAKELARRAYGSIR